MFHMGPPSRGYQNPSFLTNSHESCQQTGDVANTKSHDNTLPAIQGLSGQQPTIKALAAEAEAEPTLTGGNTPVAVQSCAEVLMIQD